MADYSITNITVLGVTSWAIMFLLTRKMFHKRSFEFSGNLVSIIHSLTFVFLASYSVQDWTTPLSPPASVSTPLQMKILTADLAFYIYDLGRYQFSLNNVPVDHIIHHLFAIAALIVGVAFQKWGSEAMAAVWIGELSASSFHLRHVLKELGYKGTNLNLAVDIVYVAAFVFAKIICGTYLMYFTLSANYPLICKVVVLAIHLLNVFWFMKLVRMCMHKYFFKQRNNASQKLHSS